MSDISTNTGAGGATDFDASLFGVEGMPGNAAEATQQGLDTPTTEPEIDPRSPAFTNQMVEFLESQLTGDEGAPGVKPDGPETPPPTAPSPIQSEEPSLTQQQLDAIAALEAADDVGGGSQATQAPVPTPDPTQVEGGVTQAEIDLNELAQRVYGRNLSRDEAINVMLFARDIEQLNPQQRQQLQESLYGGGQQTQPAPSPQTQQPYPVQPTVQTPLALPPELDPEIAAALTPLMAQVGQVQQQNQILTQYLLTQEQNQQQNQVAQIQRDYEDAKNAWFESHKTLTDVERAAIEVDLRSNNILPSQYQAFNGDAKRAMGAALDQLFWSNPVYRQRAIDEEAQKRRVEDVTQAKKQAKSTALAGPGGAPTKPAATNGQGDGRDPIAGWIEQFNQQQ